MPEFERLVALYKEQGYKGKEAIEKAEARVREDRAEAREREDRADARERENRAYNLELEKVKLEQIKLKAGDDLDMQFKRTQLQREQLINKIIEDGDKEVLKNLVKKSGSNKSSGKSSRNGGNSPKVLNYAAISYGDDAVSPTENEDHSKYFNLLKKFGREQGYRFNKSGSECHILSLPSLKLLCSFPFTKDCIRDACFLFVNEVNFEALMATGKGSIFEDCSGKDSPPEFKVFD